MLAMKQAAKVLCPPMLWALAHRAKRMLLPPAPPPAPLTLSTLAEVDEYLARAGAAKVMGECQDEHFALLQTFQLAAPPGAPADPRSREYYEHQMAFYRLISGRAEYVAGACEQLALSEGERRRPYPYYTRSTVVVGAQLQAIGFIIRRLALPPGGRVLEFGPGYGRLTLEMARTGLDVTAVDINPAYAELIGRDAAREGLGVTVVVSGMLDYEPAGRFDRVVFFECFHHCSDHAAMVARLDSLVAPGGAAVFAGETIYDDYPVPWGVRRDGQSLWAIRYNGWLELGFRTDYFLGLLAEHGWSAEVHASRDEPWNRVFIARRASERP
jgi:SAM-dependent methyltransferase